MYLVWVYGIKLKPHYFYSGSRLDAVHSDLSPNKREALILTPLPAKNIIPFH
jgi:hypothetical protein